MRISSCSLFCSLATIVLAGMTGNAVAGDRWYPLDDYDYPYPPAYYPPPPPVRDYRATPPPAYAPQVYGWSYIPPPAPSSCGVFRFWNGERCADARDELPYIGPRW